MLKSEGYTGVNKEVDLINPILVRAISTATKENEILSRQEIIGD